MFPLLFNVGRAELKISGLAFTSFVASGKTAGTIESCAAFSLVNNSWVKVDSPNHLFTAPKVGGSNYIDPVSRSAVAAVRVLKENIPEVEPEKLGCIIGTKTSNAFSIALYESARLTGKRTSPILFAHAGWNIPVAMVASEVGCRGFTSTFCCGANSFEELIQYGKNVINQDRCSVVLVGIADLRIPESEDLDNGFMESSCILCTLGKFGKELTKDACINLTDNNYLAEDAKNFTKALCDIIK